MSFNKFLKTNRAKLSSLDPDFSDFIDDYFDDPDIQQFTRRFDIEQYLWWKEAHEDLVDAFLILYDLYKRSEKAREKEENQEH